MTRWCFGGIHRNDFDVKRTPDLFRGVESKRFVRYFDQTDLLNE